MSTKKSTSKQAPTKTTKETKKTTPTPVVPQTPKKQTKAPPKPTRAFAKKEIDRVNGLMHRAPYDEWDISKVLIDAPIKGVSKTGGAKFETCNMWYLYMVDGKETKGELKIEFPHDEKAQCTTESGVRETMVELTPDQKVLIAAGQEVIREGTGKYVMYCKLDVHNPDCVKLREMLNEIYIRCVVYMEEFGAGDGCKNLLEGVYDMPKNKNLPPGPNNTVNTLRHPVWYKDREDIQANGSIVKRKDLNAPAAIPLSVNISASKWATKFVDDDMTIIPVDTLKSRGFRHIPLMNVSALFVGAKSKIRLGAASSIVTELLAPSVFEQGLTYSERKQNGISTSNAMWSDASTALADSESSSDDETIKKSTGKAYEKPESSSESSDEEDEVIPEPPQTKQKKSKTVAVTKPSKKDVKKKQATPSPSSSSSESSDEEPTITETEEAASEEEIVAAELEEPEPEEAAPEESIPVEIVSSKKSKKSKTIVTEPEETETIPTPPRRKAGSKRTKA